MLCLLSSVNIEIRSNCNYGLETDNLYWKGVLCVHDRFGIGRGNMVVEGCITLKGFKRKTESTLTTLVVNNGIFDVKMWFNMHNMRRV